MTSVTAPLAGFVGHAAAGTEHGPERAARRNPPPCSCVLIMEFVPGPSLTAALSEARPPEGAAAVTPLVTHGLGRSAFWGCVGGSEGKRGGAGRPCVWARASERAGLPTPVGRRRTVGGGLHGWWAFTLPNLGKRPHSKSFPTSRSFPRAKHAGSWPWTCCWATRTGCRCRPWAGGATPATCCWHRPVAGWADPWPLTPSSSVDHRAAWCLPRCVRGRARRRRGGRALQLGASPLRSTWLPLQSGDQPTHPPTQDAACERLAELVLNDGGVAEQVLTEALTFARSIPAAAALVNEAAVAEFQQVARSAEGQDWNKPGLTEGGRVLFEAAVFSLPPRIRNPARRACWESAARREMLAPVLTGPRLPCRRDSERRWRR